MREDLLMKVDRMTMAHGLEARVPYLDHPTAELTATFSPEILIRKRQTKAVLRDLAKTLLPDQITNRPQHGFLVPLDHWFDGNFASFASGLLSADSIRRRELLCPESVTSLLKEYQRNGKHSRMVWSLVLLELWYRKFID
jgi:asparagine synthase (glutamine-hydrolysing)